MLDIVRGQAPLPDGFDRMKLRMVKSFCERPAVKNSPACEAAQSRYQLGPTSRVIAHRESLLLRQHHDVETLFRHVDVTKREHRHLRIPSLLMRARTQATVRVWKKRPELQAHSRFGIQGGSGLPVATGAVS